MKKHTHIKGNTQQKMREKMGGRERERESVQREKNDRERERETKNKRIA